ncbi:MAG: AMP-binding protein [Phenylobacterium sp.]|nr:AMP-binding protein [Phenylobacterium sp.]
MPTAHTDRFVLDRLPLAAALPHFRFDAPHLQYPERLNAATVLLATGRPDAVALRWPGGAWTYAELRAVTAQAAGALRALGLPSGGRVLLRGWNGPMLCALWLATLQVGAVAVVTMPMLRARELTFIIRKTRPAVCVAEAGLGSELAMALESAGHDASPPLAYSPDGAGASEFDHLLRGQPPAGGALETFANDPALIAFTSGTTGDPKATVHLHRDVLAIADCFPRDVLTTRTDDVFLCSAPMGFTFGLGGHLVFPLRYGASAILLPQASPDRMFEAMLEHRPTIVMTAPTAYRAMTARASEVDLRHVRRFVSAGEHLPAGSWQNWKDATGAAIVNGIGATEMLHIFASTNPDRDPPGATGRAVAGYDVQVVDDDLRPTAPGEVGQLAVRGPTGCRYLEDDRQARYVRGGWNITGDSYAMDEAGCLWFQGRADDMIVSSGYNISGREVEEAILRHDAVAECAVVAAPDTDRGTIVKAYVVAAPGHVADATLMRSIQDFVKADIAPYKYPRAVEFLPTLPRNASGKVQRFVLRESSDMASSRRGAEDP